MRPAGSSSSEPSSSLVLFVLFGSVEALGREEQEGVAVLLGEGVGRHVARVAGEALEGERRSQRALLPALARFRTRALRVHA